MQVYIIENFEKLRRWTMIEYSHISQLAGKKNLWFTNVTRRNRRLEKLGKCFKESVADMKLDNACVLDPEAKKTLTSKEAKKFKFFIFGGILGDYPPRKRTKKELTDRIRYKVEKRNIGKKQMSTDNAVFTVYQIAKGKNMEDLKFIDKLEIPMNRYLTLELPFRYNLVRGKPYISEELLRFLRKKKGF